MKHQRKIVLCFFTFLVFPLAIFFSGGYHDHNEKIELQTDGITVNYEDLPVLTEEDKEFLISVALGAAQDVFSDTSPPEYWPERYDNISNKVFISFRANGKKRGSWSAKKDNLAETVYFSAKNTVLDERYGGNMTIEEFPYLETDIFVLGKQRIFDEYYEPGIYGITFTDGENGATYYNSVAIEHNYGTKKLMSKL